MFNVVTDQLKVSQGWVRCGHCAEVFDASLHMQATPTPQTPPQTPQQTSQLQPFSEPEFTPAPLAADPSYFSYAEEISAVLKTPENMAGKQAVDIDANLAATDTPDDRRLPVFAESETQDISETPEVSDDVSFVREARRQAFWRKPLVRVVLSLLALLLICLLLLQVAVMQRDTLAAMEPRLKPGLQMLCERLACNVGPVRQIESIVIDSSSFNKVNEAGIYQLAFALKNTGAAAVAMPSLEVTLTDTQDQPVLRRVLSPAQFGAANSMLAAGAEFSGALGLQVSSNSTPSDKTAPPNASMRVAGYRLLAFYP